MSDVVTVTKEVDMDVRVYGVTCNECRDGLDFSVDVDHDQDLVIAIDACKTCMEKARNEGIDEGTGTL